MTLRDRLLIGTVGLAAVIAALWFAVLAPKREQAADLAAQVTQAEQALGAAQDRAGKGEAAKSTYARNHATLVRLGKAVPASADVPSLVYQLESAARTAKVDFRAIGVETATAAAPGTSDTSDTSSSGGGGLVPTPFSFTFEGSYFALRRLLDEVAGFSRIKGTRVSVSGRLLTIDAVRLSAGRDGLPQVKAEVTAKAYVADVPSLAATPTTTPASQVTP